MPRIFEAPETTPPEKRVWEDPDPRVKWALDILEPEPSFQPLHYRIAPACLGAGVGYTAVRLFIRFRIMPITIGLLPQAIGLFGGFAFGEHLYQRNMKRKAEDLATVKHYIMLHPERFPEPEPMKFGDKRSFFAWHPVRRYN